MTASWSHRCRYGSSPRQPTGPHGGPDRDAVECSGQGQVGAPAGAPCGTGAWSPPQRCPTKTAASAHTRPPRPPHAVGRDAAYSPARTVASCPAPVFGDGPRSSAVRGRSVSAQTSAAASQTTRNLPRSRLPQPAQRVDGFPRRQRATAEVALPGADAESGLGGERRQAQLTPVLALPQLPHQPLQLHRCVVAFAPPTGCRPLLPPRNGSGPAPPRHRTSAPSHCRPSPLSGTAPDHVEGASC